MDSWFSKDWHLFESNKEKAMSSGWECHGQ